MTGQAASSALTPDPALVARFRGDFDRISHVGSAAPVIAAVSGGADSTALLLLLHAALPGRCRAATVDHGLRPESAHEAEAVAWLCARLGVPHVTLRGVLPARVEATANLSARARALRYALLEEHATHVGAGCIATAHHADDQAETLVMRLNRGSGVAGLAGIRAENGRIVRPLLGWRRRELEEVAAAAGLTPVDDPTNRDDRFDRARLRKALRGADWLDIESVATSARLLAEADDALDWAVTQAEQRLCPTGEGEVRLRAEGLPTEIRRRLVMRCIRRIDPTARPRGAAVARIVEALGRNERVTIGDVLCDAAPAPPVDGGTMPLWRFRKAPLRRSA